MSIAEKTVVLPKGTFVSRWIPVERELPEDGESEEDVCKNCYYNDGEVHAECVICDKITREEAISILSRPITMKNVPSDILKAHDMAIKALEQTRWIPVSERLPEDFQRVLVTVVNYKGDKVVRVAEYNNWKGAFKIKENNEQWEVGEKGLLAWMPLPQPYKGESEDKE